MVFSSITFLYYFLPIVLILYFAVPRQFKNLILLLASMFFYFCGEPKYTLLLIASIIVNYITGILIEKYLNTETSKLILTISLMINLTLLIIFKYSNFLVTNLNKILNLDVKIVKIALPIGISFYTFQAISYIIDVYRGEVKAQKNILNLALYISLFPQLIAGPIVRYKTIDEELNYRVHSFDNFAYGVKRFVLGLCKKIIIANQLGQLWNLAIYNNNKSVLLYWLGAIGFLMQIYFDFSAYSDMAIGLGKIFGFNFLENFNYPYISKSITEFWRRWHMSLGTWFRDYLYIPLGGNRTAKTRWLLNILIVWFCTGFWHGADWIFIIWGLSFGIILVLEKLFILKVLNKLPDVFAHIYTLLILIISFVLFNSANVSDAFYYIKSMMGSTHIPLLTSDSIYYFNSYKLLLIIAILLSTPLPSNLIKKLSKNNTILIIFNILEPIVYMVLLIVATGYLIDSSFNPFLYFRF